MANDDQKQYVPIDVESLLLQAESGMNPVNQRPSICKVPSILRDLSPDSFKPQLVSIGPLHKEDPNVQDIERLKSSYLLDLLKRPTSPPKQPKTKLEECFQKVKASKEKIKSSYSATEYSDDELANMMVVDGCFILEFCLKYKELKDDDSKVKDSKDEEPTLLSNIQMDSIAIDLMLLENQIPFFVLQYIFDLTKPDSISLSLTSLLHQVLLKAVHPFNIFPSVPNDSSDDSKIADAEDDSKISDPEDDSKISDPEDDTEISVAEDDSEISDPEDDSEISDPKHVLDCLHKIYKFGPSEKENASETISNYVWNMCGLRSCLSKNSDKVNAHHSVVELERSGVNFEPQSKKQKGMSINFVKASSYVLGSWKKRTLVMPTLIIQDYTEVVLRNFIAYEQLFPKENYFFTSYSFFMDRLINNAADVGNLVESGVLINNLGSHKEAATVINSICKNINVDHFYYKKEIRELDEYYNSFWPNSFANLRRTYFNNPWSFIALLGAIALFGLTAVQTIYTIMSFYP